MKKLRRLLFRFFLLLLIILIGIFIIKTISFSSKQIEVEPIAAWTKIDQSTERLSAVTQIKTTSFPERIDTAAFISLNHYLDSQYVLVDSILQKYPINEYSRVYKWQGKKSGLDPICLMAHMDVVPVEGESLKQWTEGPYSGKIDQEFVWGRGTLDDKVSILGMLEAIEKLLQKGYQPERTVYLAFGHDEEVSGLNGAKSIARWFKQQKIHFEYVLDEGSIVLEKALPGLEEPLAIIGNAEKGYMTLTLKVALNTGGHSSMPPRETAIGILSKAISSLEENPCPARMEGSTLDLLNYAGPETSFPLKTVFANLWFFKKILINIFNKKPTTSAVIRTTTAPTILKAGFKENALPTEALAMVNFRIIPGETINSVVEFVRETIDDERIEILVDKEKSYDPTPISSTDAFGFHVIQKSVSEVFPEAAIAPGLVIATTDSRHFQEVTDNIYRFLPVQLKSEDLKRIHGIDERINIESYQKVIQFYYQLILNSCK